ncbi:hypothetical protein C0J52_04157 [Blattella germanica]|nr:hypothetical protein C0J52_04157 [Blattella germanica]
MASRKIISLHLFLVFLVVAVTGHKKHRRQLQNGTNYVVDNNSAPVQCPPPLGIIRIHGQSENIASLNSGGLSNLLFMCGTTQVPYQAPSRWVMREGPDGSMVNVTIYDKKYKMVPLCCPGYTRNNEDICVPKCKGNCTNGLCVSPNQCVCYEGYALNNTGECILTCPCGCPNGLCRGKLMCVSFLSTVIKITQRITYQ